MSEGVPKFANADGHVFRAVVGLIAVIGSFAAFIGLFFIEIPARNENALMFAMGIVFGWGSAVFASEYGASTTGRKVADHALKRLDEQSSNDSKPSGTERDPLKAEIVNTKDKPANVKEAKK